MADYLGDIKGYWELAQLNWELAEAYLKDAQEQFQVVRARLNKALELKEELDKEGK